MQSGSVPPVDSPPPGGDDDDDGPSDDDEDDDVEDNESRSSKGRGTKKNLEEELALEAFPSNHAAVALLTLLGYTVVYSGLRGRILYHFYIYIYIYYTYI